MAENKLADLSMDFAVSILKVTDGIKAQYSLINQLERSATSIGAIRRMLISSINTTKTNMDN